MSPTRGSALLAVAALAAAVAGCGGDEALDGAEDERPTVLVTYSVLGAVVADLVGDAARVVVLMPDGVDPHEWEPSPRDVETVGEATVVVSNGFDLEESLLDILDTEAAVHFKAGDHVSSPRLDDAEESGIDPHFWMDPLAMSDVVAALAPVLAEAGIDVTDRVDAVAADMQTLVEDVEAELAPIAPEDRLLVTGHESLGWFADRFDLEVVGAVIPSFSSDAEASAGDVAELIAVVEDTGVTTIFTELGTPASVVGAITSATGAGVIEIATHDMPDDGSYRTFVLDVAERLVAGLAPESS
jgi:zinc/manganese transport system substrate-binding protein